MGADSSHQLSNEELEEIVQNTNFSKNEIRELYEKFTTDFPDGEITPEGFGRMYAGLFPEGDVRKFSRHVFRAYDQDGNGSIDFKEFMSTLSVAAKGSLDAKLKWAFKLYDIDGNGSISRPEAVEMIMAIYRMQGMSNPREKADEAALQFFVLMDKNKDDALSQQEFIKAVQNSDDVRKLLEGTMA